MIAGVLLAGLAGLLFSPIAARLRGIYLGVASLALVFIGQHVLNSLDVGDRRLQRARRHRSSRCSASPSATPTPTCSSWACRSGRPSGSGTSGWSSPSPPTCSRGTCCAAAPAGRCRPCATARSPRRSWASTSSATRRASSSSARCTPGSPGVMYALSIGSIAPESFGLELSILFLAMIVLGGLGSVGGAALGRAVRQRPAAGLPALRRRRPVRRRRGRGRAGRRRGGPLLLRPRDHPRHPLRARRSGRPRRALPPQGPRPRRRTATSRSSAATSSSTTSVPSDRPAQGSTT